MASEWKIKVNGALKPFWGIIFLFNRDENKTIGALSSVSFAEYRSGIKAAVWTLENKNGNVQYQFEVEFTF